MLNIPTPKNYKVLHLHTGLMNPFFLKIKGVLYVLLVETKQGWLLVDSGFGRKDLDQPDPITRIFSWFMRLPKESLPVIKQLSSLKIDPQTVKHITFTHLHLDHAGGLSDFPWATAHVYQKEFNAARKKLGALGLGYQSHHWKGHQHWQVYHQPDSTWFGLPAITLNGFEPTIQLIPMAGHTPGHCMVAIKNRSGWILQTGSACFPFHFDRITNIHPVIKTLLRPFWGNNYKKLAKILHDTDESIDVLTGHDYQIWLNHQGS